MKRKKIDRSPVINFFFCFYNFYTLFWFLKFIFYILFLKFYVFLCFFSNFIFLSLIFVYCLFFFYVFYVYLDTFFMWHEHFIVSCFWARDCRFSYPSPKLSPCQSSCWHHQWLVEQVEPQNVRDDPSWRYQRFHQQQPCRHLQYHVFGDGTIQECCQNVCLEPIWEAWRELL